VLVDDTATTLEDIEAKGGKIVQPVLEIPNGPTIALFADPAGETIGLRKA
jgi:predicted enzyme related to lactoylglutathione lyase